MVFRRAIFEALEVKTLVPGEAFFKECVSAPICRSNISRIGFSKQAALDRK
jgi:hypothetical protein